jgi:magnesium chelatase family protein
VLASVRSYALLGVDAREVRVEVDVGRGLPSFSIVGLPDAAVREARERVRAALLNSDFKFPQDRITVNLAPANLPKAGPGFDLAIAAALAIASGQLSEPALAGAALMGELALDGSIRAAPGALPMAELARRRHCRTFIVPPACAREAALANLIAPNGDGPLDPVRVIPIDSLAHLRDVGNARAIVVPDLPEPAVNGDLPDLADLRGQPNVRRALEVAAAGGHSLLITGPPGAGKSLAAQRLPSILPPLSVDEAIEVMRIASACGQSSEPTRARVRPYRAPHHTISAAGLVGGGAPPRPGEITLAHRGVLFLDELPEFSRDALEALRQPLEEGRVSVVRARYRIELPCRFMLVAAANPCPCGRGGDGDCECSMNAVRRYRARLSGALADRIDITLSVDQPPPDALHGPPGESSAAIRERVIAARERQAKRLGPGRVNADMTVAEVRRKAGLTPEAKTRLGEGHAILGLSGRGNDRVVRVARTIADLAGREQVEPRDVSAALSLRRVGSE